MSFARIIVFALALTQVVGLADLVLDDACEEICTDHGCGSDCLPGAPCRCHCPSTTAMLGGRVESMRTITASSVAPIEAARRSYASPDPHEILHVPRLAV